MQISGTKKLIRESFFKLLGVKKDIDDVTVSEIIKIAGTSRQTFYYHFQDIYDLLTWIIEIGFEELINGMAGKDICRHEIESLFSYLDEYKVLIYKCLQSSRRDFIEETIEQNITKYLANYYAICGLGKNLSAEDLDFANEFYSRAVTSMCIKYVSGKYSKISTPALIDKVERLVAREMLCLKQ